MHSHVFFEITVKTIIAINMGCCKSVLAWMLMIFFLLFSGAIPQSHSSINVASYNSAALQDNFYHYAVSYHLELLSRILFVVGSLHCNWQLTLLHSHNMTCWYVWYDQIPGVILATRICMDLVRSSWFLPWPLSHVEHRAGTTGRHRWLSHLLNTAQ